MEAFPPESSVQPLPAYSRGETTVSWGGWDPGGSGIANYEVQYRDTASGSWIDWLKTSYYTSHSFSGTAGHTYYFRVRAMDGAQNLEEWLPGDGDAHTTFYTWGARGTVRDNTDAPVAGAVVTTTPEALAVIPSDVNGDYAAYVAASVAMYTATWGKSGYGVLPATSYAAGQDAQLDAILPPANNIVLNWGFESGSLEPDWQPSGVIPPTVTDTIKHTGDLAALLGQPLWFAPPVDISNTDRGCFEPQVAAGVDGIVHVVWHGDVTDGNTDVFYARRSTDGTWANPLNLSNSADQSEYPQVAVDGSGVVHVVWHEGTYGNYDIYYANRSPEGSWSAHYNVSSSTQSCERPQPLVDDQGVVHIVWNAGDLYYARRSSDGTWSSTERISQNGGHAYQLAVDGLGSVHVVWRGTGGRVFYANLPQDGIWSSPQSVSYNSGYFPQLAVDPGENVHVVWSEELSGSSHDIFYANRSSSGVWSSPRNIANNDGYSTEPQLAVDESGIVHVVWSDSSPGNWEILYARRTGEHTWSTPENISNTPNGAGIPRLAVDRAGTLHAVWGEGDYIFYTSWSSQGVLYGSRRISNSSTRGYYPQLAVDGSLLVHMVWEAENGIHYGGSIVAGQSSDSSIAQSFTVPIAMDTPTLSFLYQLGGASTINDTWLNAMVHNGISPTILFSTTMNIEVWTHRWFDLTPWAGQNITLTFNVHETEGYPYAWAYLDEVTLGSAHPDLWVTKPHLAVLPGEQVAFTIIYGNRGGAAVSSVQVTDEMPPELSFVSASSSPSAISPSLVWDVGDLPAKSGPFAVLVTGTMSSTAPLWSLLTNTASIDTASPELETANNSSQAGIFVGRRTYLPVVFKEH